jgi:hypothetical protein
MADAKKEPKKNLDWLAVREDFIVTNLDPELDKPYTYRDVAKKWGVARETVGLHGKAEGWREELAARAKARSDASIEAQQRKFADKEAAIREKHANVAMALTAKAVVKLQNINAEDLTTDQMIKILQFSLPEERDARGIPRIAQTTIVSPLGDAADLETPAMKIERRLAEKRVKAVLVGIIAEEEDGSVQDDVGLLTEDDLIDGDDDAAES